MHGAQEQSAYNGYLESGRYHPLFVFNQGGDCLAATLRPGNVHSPEGWITSCLSCAEDALALPEFIRLRGRIKAANKDVLLSAPDQYIRGRRGGRRQARTRGI
jgi:Transposase DDE domain group 1